LSYRIGFFSPYQITLLQEAFMQRKTTAGTLVLDRMNYSSPSIVSKWKETFPNKKSPKAPSNPQKVAKTIRVLNTGTGEKNNGPAATLIKSIPIVFQLQRKNHPSDFERMSFVVRACSQDPRKPDLKMLHVEQTETGSILVGCDGYRLHVAEISCRIKSGDYKPVMTKEELSLMMPDDKVRYPAWNSFVPDTVTKRGVIDLEESGFGKDRKKAEKLTLAFNACIRQSGETINLRYLEDLLKKEWVVYTQEKKGKALVLKEQGDESSVYAVIMPLCSEKAEGAVKAA
jgi:hypothetical protein